jgi:uncharacterized protein YbbK (DUF523 family)
MFHDPVTEKIRLGISSCLLVEKVRYDSGHKLDHFLKETLGKYVEWVAVYPEVEYGLPVPREAMRLENGLSAPRLVTTRTKIDHTKGMLQWASLKKPGNSKKRSFAVSCSRADLRVRACRGCKFMGPLVFR